MNAILKKYLKAALPKPLVLEWQVRRAMRGCADPEVRLLPLMARNGAFVDIGANLGGWSGPAARVFKQVHAFEPLAELALALRRAAPRNMAVHALALSSHDGTARLGVPQFRGEALATRASLQADANAGFNETARQVPIATLDSIGLRDIDAIKIDVEGHEQAVIDGARETLERSRPTLVVEIEERHHRGRSEAIIEGIMARDYLCHFVRSGRLHPFRADSIGDLQRPTSLPGPGIKAAAYINNFIFTPVERRGEVDAMRQFLLGAHP